MIKKGSRVKVLVGKDKKKEGEVIEIDRSNNRAKIKGLNLIKKHTKTTKENPFVQMQKGKSTKNMMIYINPNVKTQ